MTTTAEAMGDDQVEKSVTNTTTAEAMGDDQVEKSVTNTTTAEAMGDDQVDKSVTKTTTAEAMGDDQVDKSVTMTTTAEAMGDDQADKAEREQAKVDQELREKLFKHLDANNDGSISAQELGDALENFGLVTADEVQGMMKELDTDKDGHISWQEFTNFALANSGLVKDVAKLFIKQEK